MIQHEPPIWTWPVVLTLVFTTVTGVAAVVALLYAHIAYRGARRSNSIAADARQLAEEANEIATRAESREIERHDVYWDPTSADSGHTDSRISALICANAG